MNKDYSTLLKACSVPRETMGRISGHDGIDFDCVVEFDYGRNNRNYDYMNHLSRQMEEADTVLMRASFRRATVGELRDFIENCMKKVTHGITSVAQKAYVDGCRREESPEKLALHLEYMKWYIKETYGWMMMTKDMKLEDLFDKEEIGFFRYRFELEKFLDMKKAQDNAMPGVKPENTK
ncbi:MAG: hypothetical protein LBJ73_02525 [Rickettsiales bacterium]|jgi:hypothetical protein|nr:hypothetical protein [Rickettsiales bacterium]